MHPHNRLLLPWIHPASIYEQHPWRIPSSQTCQPSPDTLQAVKLRCSHTTIPRVLLHRFKLAVSKGLEISGSSLSARCAKLMGVHTGLTARKHQQGVYNLFLFPLSGRGVSKPVHCQHSASMVTGVRSCCWHAPATLEHHINCIYWVLEISCRIWKIWFNISLLKFGLRKPWRRNWAIQC